MSTHYENLLALANEAAAVGPNMTEAQSGGGARRMLPEGYAFGRLVEVVELGVHPQEFGGVAKQPAPEQQLAFALWGQNAMPDGSVETYHDAATGAPHIERLLPMSISRNEKAGAFLLFRMLNWKGTATHFAQLLGQAFLVKIHHVAKNKTDKTLVSRIDMKGFLPPLDPVSKQPYPIPEAPAEALKLFLWDKPTKGTWDSLFIEGTWDAKPAENGKPAREAQSKNKTQEYILSALNFQGSPLQVMLGNGQPAAALPSLPSSAPGASPAVPPAASASTATTSPTSVPVAQVAVPLVAVPTAAAPPQVPPIATVAVPAVALPSSPVLPA